MEPSLTQLEAAFNLGIKVTYSSQLLTSIIGLFESSSLSDEAKRLIATEDLSKYQSLVDNAIQELEDYRGSEFERSRSRLEETGRELQKAAEPYLPTKPYSPK